jgi:hypothetical protein
VFRGFDEPVGFVHWHAGEDGLLNRRNTFAGSGNFDEEIAAVSLSVKVRGRLDRSGCIEGNQRRHLQRHPTVHADSGVVDRAKEIGGTRQIASSKNSVSPDLPSSVFRLMASSWNVESLVNGEVENGRRLHNS